ncbi:hypothetical protein P3T76_001469 [Phytophthora citrophthora]|uniref:Uncharacterized protein n=1 Tax=Phytophthora citrophthora TaxID=4793 RepID=A0AAD9GYK5_9STRA|nr:hypothetical protein P3T76_001469 [Phytophthora citrophthora]
MACSIVAPELGSLILSRDIFTLYYQIRSIYQRVLPCPEAGGTTVSSTIPLSLGVVVTASTPERSRSRFFPSLNAGDWNKLIQPLDNEVGQHPKVQLGCPRERVHQTLTQIMRLRQSIRKHNIVFGRGVIQLNTGILFSHLSGVNAYVANTIESMAKSISKRVGVEAPAVPIERRPGLPVATVENTHCNSVSRNLAAAQ